ncbi:hypothetical protein XENTR_v10020707 [Xenopus tropicalis]|nr:hypothetical protein XENTR_v10020707 [Xenopus tropicalis]
MRHVKLFCNMQFLSRIIRVLLPTKKTIQKYTQSSVYQYRIIIPIDHSCVQNVEFTVTLILVQIFIGLI